MSVPIPLASIKKVLIRGVNWIGDTVLTLPALEAMRKLLPEAKLTMLTREGLAALFRHCPWVDEVLTIPQGRGLAGVEHEMRHYRKIRADGCDLALVLPRSIRTALLPYCAGIRYRLGYACNGRGILLTHAVNESKEMRKVHQADYYYRLVSLLGPLPARPLPRLYIGNEEYAWAKSFLSDAGILSDQTIIALHPGSTYGPAKCWPLTNFVRLARRLMELTDNRILLVGGVDNADMIEYMYLSLSCRPIRAVGKDLLQLAALLQQCAVLITNDTGPMHLAAAVGTPVVAIFGSTDPHTTAPLGHGHRVLRKEIDCSPCLKRRCPYDHGCMKSITLEEVEMAVQEQLSSMNALNRRGYHRSINREDGGQV